MREAVDAATSVWNDTVVRDVVAGHSCLVYERRPRHLRTVFEQASRWGEREFLVQGERRVSYAHHARLAAGVAHRLRGAAVEPGERVMLLAANAIEWVAAFWGTVLADAVVVAGNSWWSADEIRHAMSRTKPAVVVADERRRECLPADVAVIPIEDVSADAATTVMRDASRNEDDAAVILFTSGTTGAPKGAVLSHRAVIANLQNLLIFSGHLNRERGDDSRRITNLYTAPLFHQGGIQVMLTTFTICGRLVLLDGGFDAARVLRVIEKERVTTWGGVPTTLARTVKHPDLAVRDVSSVCSLSLGGAPVPRHVVEEASRAFPNARRRVGTLYGATETGGVVTNASGRDVADRPGTAGRALPVVEVRIEAADDMPRGIGEILVRSPAAMTGYWGEDESPIDGDGWVHTGDIGRLDDDGYLFVLDRSKDVIIRGGENIASANVEAHLLDHPAVREVAVIGVPDEELGEQVGAIVVLEPGAGAVDEHVLAAHARAVLAHFEVPTVWWFRDEPLPVNTIGKPDKKRLKSETLRA